MHRPTLTKWFFSLALVSATSFADAKEVLRLLAWPGYADQDLVEVFEKNTMLLLKPPLSVQTMKCGTN